MVNGEPLHENSVKVEVGGSWAVKGPFEVSAIFDPPGFLAPSWFRIQEH